MTAPSARNTVSVFWLILTLSLLSMIGPFSIDTYLPAFPAMEKSFQISREVLAHSLGFYLIAFGIATLFWGPISDHFGRKKVILIAMFIYLIASIGCRFSHDYHHFVLFRILQGFAVSGGLVAGRAMVRDLFETRQAQQVMAYVMMCFAIAPAIAPIIGAALADQYGWRSIFLFLCAFSLLTTLLVSTIFKESLAVEKRQPLHLPTIFTLYFRALSNHQFVMIVMVYSVCFAGLFLFIAGSPSLMFDFLHLAADDFWLLFTPLVIGLSFGSFLTGKLSFRYSAKRIASTALCIMTIASIANVCQALLLEPSPLSLILPLALYAFGIGIGLSVFTLLGLNHLPNNLGSAAALINAGQMLTSAVAVSVILPWVSHSLFAFSITQLILVSIALVCWFRFNLKHVPCPDN